MEFEHIDRVTIVPHTWVVPLVVLGILMVLWHSWQGMRAINGEPVGDPPLLTLMAACAAAMWVTLVRFDKDWADAAIVGLLAMLVVSVCHWLLRPRKNATAEG